MTVSKHRVVVITGASAGVGRAVARALAREGARIGLIARGIDGLEGTKHEIEQIGGEALILPLDITDASAVGRNQTVGHRRFGVRQPRFRMPLVTSGSQRGEGRCLLDPRPDRPQRA